MMKMNKCYSDLLLLETFKERYFYLKLHGQVGEDTFGVERWINQSLYKSSRWKRTRSQIIIRDNGCDLGIEGHEMDNHIVIHHINPLTFEDIEEESDLVFDPENLICCSPRTHQAIHFGDEELLPKDFIERRPNDTCLWR